MWELGKNAVLFVSLWIMSTYVHEKGEFVLFKRKRMSEGREKNENK